jgi:hypothetical protein
MISGNIHFNGAELPYTLTKDKVVAYFMQHKGKAFDLIESLITELKKDENEITMLKLKKLSRIINENKKL